MLSSADMSKKEKKLSVVQIYSEKILHVFQCKKYTLLFYQPILPPNFSPLFSVFTTHTDELLIFML